MSERRTDACEQKVEGLPKSDSGGNQAVQAVQQVKSRHMYSWNPRCGLWSSQFQTRRQGCAICGASFSASPCLGSKHPYSLQFLAAPRLARRFAMKCLRSPRGAVEHLLRASPIHTVGPKGSCHTRLTLDMEQKFQSQDPQRE
eukprot:3671994-Amphidinium_carterae.1